jgi:hypothetical protein
MAKHVEEVWKMIYQECYCSTEDNVFGWSGETTKFFDDLQEIDAVLDDIGDLRLEEIGFDYTNNFDIMDSLKEALVQSAVNYDDQAFPSIELAEFLREKYDGLADSLVFMFIQSYRDILESKNKFSPEY